MADDADLAQVNHDEFMSSVMEQRKIARDNQLKNLPNCENFEDCGNKCFVTKQGTITKICKQCYEEMKS